MDNLFDLRGLVWLPIVLAAIGFLLGKMLTPENMEKFTQFIYKPVFVVFRGITMALNGVTGGWWNKVGEPYFKLIIHGFFSTILRAADDGLESDNGVEMAIDHKTKKVVVKNMPKLV